jgi:phage gp46-like protein
MGDISLQWNPALGYADWQVGVGDLATGNTLETAIIRSLFTDARAPADLNLDDPRGVWTDTYNGFQSGSLLWLLERAKINDSQALLRQAERYATMALQWLVTAGAVATVAAAALYLSAGVIGLTIVVTEPSGTTSSFQYAYLYSGG